MPTKEKIRQTVLDLFRTEKEEWLARARQEAQRIAHESGEVCADDIHQALPVPKGIDPRIMGKVFVNMRFVRFQKSKRAECHHRIIGVFTNNNKIHEGVSI